MKRRMSAQVKTAYDLLQKQILYYELEPGAMISDNQISKSLNMSRAPVREAMLLLEMDGLICDSSDGRSLVAPIKLDDIVDIIHVRSALESEAVRLLAKSGWLNEQQAQTLQDIHKRFISAAAKSDASEQYELDDLFHATFVEYSGSQRIISMLGQMRLQMQRARWLNQIMPERQRNAVEEHTQIINALLSKDLDQSIRAIRQHLTNSEHAFETVYHSGHMRQISKMLSSAFAEQSPQT